MLKLSIHKMGSSITLFNSLWPSDTIWQQRSLSTLAQVMACCLTAPSHYLNQCWLTISKVPWQSPDDISMRSTADTCQRNKTENWIFNITSKGQWVKSFQHLPGANWLKVCYWRWANRQSLPSLYVQQAQCILAPANNHYLIDCQ